MGGAADSDGCRRGGAAGGCARAKVAVGGVGDAWGDGRIEMACGPAHGGAIGIQVFPKGLSIKKRVGGFFMRIGWATIFRELVKITLFFAAGAALLVVLLQFE